MSFQIQTHEPVSIHLKPETYPNENYYELYQQTLLRLDNSFDTIRELRAQLDQINQDKAMTSEQLMQLLQASWSFSDQYQEELSKQADKWRRMLEVREALLNGKMLVIQTRLEKLQEIHAGSLRELQNTHAQLEVTREQLNKANCKVEEVKAKLKDAELELKNRQSPSQAQQSPGYAQEMEKLTKKCADYKRVAKNMKQALQETHRLYEESKENKEKEKMELEEILKGKIEELKQMLTRIGTEKETLQKTYGERLKKQKDELHKQYQEEIQHYRAEIAQLKELRQPILKRNIKK